MGPSDAEGRRLSQILTHIPFVMSLGIGYIAATEHGLPQSLSAVVAIVAAIVGTAIWIYSPLPNDNFRGDKGMYWGWSKDTDDGNGQAELSDFTP